MNPQHTISWRPVRLGISAGAFIGVVCAVLFLLASPHVPLGTNLFWPVIGGAVIGAVTGLAIVGVHVAFRHVGARRR